MVVGVQVKLEDGSLVGPAFSPPITARDILEEIHLILGLKGFLLDSDKLWCGPSKVFTGGEALVFVEKRPRSTTWFDEHDKLPSASELANDTGAIRKFLDKDFPIYNVGRKSGGMPLILANDSFSTFVQALAADRTLSATEWRFVLAMMEMSDYFEDEAGRQEKVRRCLEEFLDQAWPGRFKVTGVEEANMKIEALVNGAWVIVCFIQVKHEFGVGGDLCIQALKHYGLHVKATMLNMKPYYWTSCMPVLVVEVAGATIRVGGAVFHDKPGYEPLTPYLHVLKFVRNERYASHLFRALAAIPATLSSIADFYRQLLLPTAALQERLPETQWPAYIVSEKRRDAGLDVVQWSGSRNPTKRLLFLLQYSDGREVMFKFCQRYGDEVHRLWSNAQLAPRFEMEQLSDGWRVVKMEYLSDEAGWFSLDRLEPGAAGGKGLDPAAWGVCRQAVVEAYRRVHALYPSHVHGDLRKRNVVYNTQSSEVRFVDFDWAGMSGSVCYPPFLNTAIAWPQGVQACHPMLADHDQQMLIQELGVAFLC